MAPWNTPLPDEAVEGELTHIEDHNKIVDAIREVRTAVDTKVASPAIASIWVGTQAEYDALDPDPATLYMVTGAVDPVLAFGEPAYSGSGTSPVSSLDVTTPGDLQDGDLLIIALRSQDSAGDEPWAAPAGFTLMSPDPFLPNGALRVGAVFVKHVVDAAAEPATHTFTGPTGRAVAISVACTPVSSGATSREVWGPYAGSSQDGGTVTLEPIAGTADIPVLFIAALGAECTAGVSHTPTETPEGFTEIGNTQSTLDDSAAGSRTALWLGWREDSKANVGTLSGGFAGSSGPALYVGVFSGAV